MSCFSPSTIEINFLFLCRIVTLTTRNQDMNTFAANASTVNTPILRSPTPAPSSNVVDKTVPVKTWANGNKLYLYNVAHIYGTYRVHMKELLDWCKDGKVGTLFKEDMAGDVHIFGYKADPAKKFITLNVRSDNVFRTVKMFEPMSSQFIANLADQCHSTYQSYYNLVDPDRIPRTIVLPFSAVGQMLDNDYNGKRTTFLQPEFFSTSIKHVDDCVYPLTSLAEIDGFIAQLSASTNN